MGRCGYTCDDKCEHFDGCCMADWDNVRKISDNVKCPYSCKYCEEYDGNCVRCIIDHE